MPQETNLNVAPYFDDFDPASNYYKVLFKPAYPVQARELNNLQSILQDQVEKFGNHVFKEGAKVIPGQLTYLSDFDAIQIEDTFLGVPVSIYLDQIKGKTIKGASSGVTAQVVKCIDNEESERGTYTIYVNYFESGNTDEESQTFSSDEVLTLTEPIQYATTFIAAGEGFAKTLTQNAPAVGSAFAMSSGVYYLRGHFVSVYDDIEILDQYSTKPSYRIGFNVREEVVSADVDPTLNDNAQGFNNFTAPGADRVRITATLSKRDPEDFEDSNFVQLAEVRNGVLRDYKENTEYNYLGDELARRTFDESGNYYIREFVTSVKDSLNNDIGNRGLFTSDQKTSQGSTPSKDLAIYKVAPGKAYVKGYEVNVRAPVYLDAPKPRTTKTLEGQGINFGFGPTFTVNRAHGSPTLGFADNNFISMRDERIGSSDSAAAGKEIGVARIYDIALESGSYDTTTPDLNQWDVSLFDIQTYTEFEVNQSSTLTIPTYVKGENSGATAYLRYATTGVGFTAYDVNGEFFVGEKLTFNGDQTTSRTVTKITNFEISDTKSLHSNVSGNIFNADLIPTIKTTVGIASIKAESGGVSVITSPATTWPGITSTGNLIRYSNPTNDLSSLARVTNVSTNELTVEAVQNVSNYIVGDLPSTDISVTDLSIVETQKQRQSSTGNAATSESLYSLSPKQNVSEVDTTNSQLVIRRTFTVSITNNTMSSVSTGANETFLPFDEERYTLIRSNGQTETLTQDRFSFTSGNTTLTINGLGSNDTGATLVTTINKNKVKSKIKKKNINQSIIIDKSTNPASGIGETTLNDGLTYGSFPFGTRVQDEQISINVPDVNMMYALYESSDENDPVLPSMTTGSLDGPTATTNDIIIGDTVVGALSGTRALVFERKSDTSINFIFESSKTFANGEVVNFLDSGVSAVALNIDKGSKSITNNYRLLSGQTDTFYGVSKLKRRSDAQSPTKKLKLCYISSSYDSSDDGDITTASSYVDYDFSTEIPYHRIYRLSDMIDARPRVSPYTVSAGARSPFEFFGRSFTGNQHSSKDIIASDESIVVDYSYYLGRIDRIYLTAENKFIIKYGVPDDEPKLPDPISGAMNIANVTLPPYLYTTSDAEIEFVNHKRYQMSDISRLEQRINNLEYYTSLSQLETNAINQFTPDANGLDRFKSGIFIDNFTSVIPQDPALGIKNSIDKQNNVCRPSHYCNAINLVLGNNTISGIGTTTNSNGDSKFAEVLGSNVVRNDDVLSLSFTEVEWLKNPFATRSESVTPYMVTFWAGSITMTPNTDVWIDVNQIEANNVEIEGSFEAIAAIMGAEVSTDEDGIRSGVTPIVWESWETNDVDISSSSSTSQNTSTDSSTRLGTQEEFDTIQPNGWFDGRDVETAPQFQVSVSQDTTVTSTTTTTTTTLHQSRQGSQTIVTERIDTESLGERVVSREILHFMRSRNIMCTGTSLKPYSRLYSFFDSVDVNKFCFSKLLEIEMTSGLFQVGETVVGTMPIAEDNEDIAEGTVAAITFRVASPNHKYGPYNNPSDRFDSNPYNRDLTIPSQYSETSTILNIDTNSLQDMEQPEFEGFIAETMILRGQSSGAEATITNNRLIADRLGTLIYNFQVPPTNDASNPTFETGQNRMRLTGSPTNSSVEGTYTTSAETTFYSQGSIDTTQETTLSLGNADVSVDDSFLEERQQTSTSTSTSIDNVVSSDPTITGYTDPLAQSFIVDDQTGVFISSVDVFFQEKPEISLTPVTCQIRTVELGTPTTTILAYSEVDIDPRDITVSQDASIAHNIKFKAPVYLEANTEYAIVLLSHNTEYRVWISQLGEVDVSTLGQEEGQILVSTQPLLGSLFKSQNATTWTPSQYEDLTFKLYRADFDASGSAQFFNPDLPKKLEIISKDNIEMGSREARIQISGIVTSSIEPGNTIIQTNTNATGKFQSFGGAANGLTITNAGIGFTPSAGYFVFTGIALTSLTGTGINATANIAVENGVGLAATIASGGTGHQIGDVLSPISIGNLSLGSGMKITVNTTSGNNQLNLTGVQGKFSTNSSDVLNFTNSSGVTVAIGTVGTYPLNPIREIRDGQHLNVKFRNHGMYSAGDQVKLSNVESDVAPVKLLSDYSSTSNGNISIASTVNFTNFENVSVGATNPGYIRIGDEIISYTGFSGNELTGISRGIDNTIVASHKENNSVRLYEINGVSLRRINRTHSLNNVTESDPITLDSYKLKIDVTDTDYGTNRSGSSLPELFFKETKTGGGNKARSTYNQPYQIAIPKFNYITPTGTEINASMRTTSGSSISGRESSFIDQGYTPITFKREVYFDTPRIVASKINESQFLGDLPANKSLTVDTNLTTTDSRLSPMIDLSRTTMVFISNRVNEAIGDYSSDPRANQISGDPTSFIYATKKIVLANPATSIQVTFDAYVSTFNDVRVFYSFSESDNINDATFIPFPGYRNKDASGRPGVIIDKSLSDGTPDTKTPSSDQILAYPPPQIFREYQFTADLLPSFSTFRIKVLGTSTNMSVVPQLRNIRVVALA